MLVSWVSEYEKYGESAFPGHGSALSNMHEYLPPANKHLSFI